MDEILIGAVVVILSVLMLVGVWKALADRD
jgi:hypothetical protein